MSEFCSGAVNCYTCSSAGSQMPPFNSKSAVASMEKDEACVTTPSYPHAHSDYLLEVCYNVVVGFTSLHSRTKLQGKPRKCYHVLHRKHPNSLSNPLNHSSTSRQLMTKDTPEGHHFRVPAPSLDEPPEPLGMRFQHSHRHDLRNPRKLRFVRKPYQKANFEDP